MVARISPLKSMDFCRNYGIRTQKETAYKPTIFIGEGVVFTLLTSWPTSTYRSDNSSCRLQGTRGLQPVVISVVCVISPNPATPCLYQESPRQTKPKKGPKRKVHEFRPFLWILVFFLRKTSTIHIELWFRNAPGKSSWTDLSLVCRGHSWNNLEHKTLFPLTSPAPPKETINQWTRSFLQKAFRSYSYTVPRKWQAECPCEMFMNWPFFGLVCRGHSWWAAWVVFVVSVFSVVFVKRDRHANHRLGKP